MSLKNVLLKILFLSLVFFSFLDAKQSVNLTSFLKNTNNENKIIVELNSKVLESIQLVNSIGIHISEDNIIEFNIKNIKKRKNGSIKWRGENKSKKAKILLTYLDGVLFGEIRLGKAKYKLIPKNKDLNKYVIFKEDKSKSIKLNNDIKTPTIKPKRLKQKIETSLNVQENITTLDNQIKLQLAQSIYEKSIVNGDTVLDVMILYTRRFANYYGNGTQARIQYLLDIANEGLENSQTNVELNLALVQLFDDLRVAEGNNITNALPNLRNNEDIIALKRRHNIDIVSLFRRYDGISGSCGLGYLLDDLSTSSARSVTFNVVEDKQGNEGGYYCPDQTFIHEVGHNFGCAHDRDHTSGYGVFSYSYGYDISNEFATIMSYDYPEINYFSNPNLTYNSLAMGVVEGNSNSADNAKTIRETKYYIDNQYLEELENAEQLISNTLQGVLSNKDDRDMFSVELNGEVIFSNLNSFYLNIYDENGYLIVVGESYQSLTHTFENGTYELVVSSSSDQTGVYFNNTNVSYSINLTSNVSIIDTDQDGIPDETDLDDDNDGMSDEYELANALNPLVNDSQLDKDNDEKTNLEEFNDGTQANDKNSRVFTINLNAGWNLVSLPLNALVNISTLNNPNIEIIKSLQNNVWKNWIKNSNSNTLFSLEDGYGYWIKVSQNSSISILGDGLADIKTIEADNWNMLGSQNIENIDTFFTNNPNIKILWKYKNGKYGAISNDMDISQDLNDKNIEVVNEIKADEGFFVK